MRSVSEGLLAKIRFTRGGHITYHCLSIKREPFVVKYCAPGHLEIREASDRAWATATGINVSKARVLALVCPDGACSVTPVRALSVRATNALVPGVKSAGGSACACVPGGSGVGHDNVLGRGPYLVVTAVAW